MASETIRGHAQRDICLFVQYDKGQVEVQAVATTCQMADVLEAGRRWFQKQKRVGPRLKTFHPFIR
jgi:hypothetical protein